LAREHERLGSFCIFDVHISLSIHLNHPAGVCDSVIQQMRAPAADQSVNSAWKMKFSL